MTPPDPSRKLDALLKRVRLSIGPVEQETWLADHSAGQDPLVLQFIYAVLSWEAGAARAGPALKRLLGAVVDYNELRVCLPDEVAAILGERYPRALEHASRLRAALNDLYKREHCVTLGPILNMPKRDARLYLASLEGMPHYAASRLSLLTFGGHAFPLDERLHHILVEADAVPADLSVEDASGWLERHFRAGEAIEPYLLLEAWHDKRPDARKAAAPRARARTAPRKKRPAKP